MSVPDIMLVESLLTRAGVTFDKMEIDKEGEVGCPYQWYEYPKGWIIKTTESHEPGGIGGCVGFYVTFVFNEEGSIKNIEAWE